MTVSAPVRRVVKILTDVGYVAQQAPFVISSVPFEFDSMLIGSARSLDLIVVIDTLTESEPRIRQKVEGLGRALDLAASRRPLTVVLVGPPPRPLVMEAIIRVCRVLQVGTPVGSHADAQLADALAVLLPLRLPASSDTIVDPLGEVRRRMATELTGEPAVEMYLESAAQGADAVREKLQGELRRVIVNQLEEPNA